MDVVVPYGRDSVTVTLPGDRWVGVRREPIAPALADPVAAVRTALETPHRYPALWRALTPDDHVAVVVDEDLPRVGLLLAPILEHITRACVAPEAITLLCATGGSQAWVDDLPDDYQDVRIEVHDPGNRKALSYLATTRGNRRIYLNRTAVDADQLVVLTRRGYDVQLGCGGAEGALYPALSDAATRLELASQLSLEAPGEESWALQREATEVAWLLGAPFLVQVIEGAGDEIAHVIGGVLDSSAEGRRLLDARWRETVDRPADMVVATLSGDPTRHGFEALARALHCAARVVQPNGRIILLTQAVPALGPGGDLLRQAEDPAAALAGLDRCPAQARPAVLQWASAAQKARIYLLSGLEGDVAEELFTVPMDDAAQAQRLLDGAGKCLVVADAHKALVIPEPASGAA